MLPTTRFGRNFAPVLLRQVAFHPASVRHFTKLAYPAVQRFSQLEAGRMSRTMPLLVARGQWAGFSTGVDNEPASAPPSSSSVEAVGTRAVGTPGGEKAFASPWPARWKKAKKYGRKGLVKGKKVAVWTASMTGRFLLGTFRVSWSFVKNPRIVFQWWADLKEALHHMSAWIKNGSKLFGKNVQLSTQLVMKQARGDQLTLREHKLLVRTVTDLFKLVPFSLFVIIPFAELALPIALRLFPNMLPSTFNDKKSDHALLMRRMKAKSDMAAFFNEVITEKNKQILEEKSSKFRDRAIELQEFQETMLERLEEGEGSGPYFPSVLELKRFSKLFHSEFQLEQMSVEQLKAICAMLGLRPYAFKSHIVLQLRHYVTRLRSEDRDILWEGVNNLTHAELAEANRMRGMPYVNVDDDRLRMQLSSWLEVSSNKDIPVSLLLWSRTFFMAQQPGMESQRLINELKNTLAEATSAAAKAKAQITNENQPHETAAPPEEAVQVEEDAAAKDSLLKREVERRKDAAETSAKRLEELEREARQIQEEQSERKKAAGEIITEATGVDEESGVIRNDQVPAGEELKEPAVAEPATVAEYPTVDSEDEKLDRDELLRKIDRLEEELALYQSVVEKQEGILMRQIGHLSTLRETSWPAALKDHDKFTEVETELNSMYLTFEEDIAAVQALIEDGRKLSDVDAAERRFYPSSGEESEIDRDSVEEQKA